MNKKINFQSRFSLPAPKDAEFNFRESHKGDLWQKLPAPMVTVKLTYSAIFIMSDVVWMSSSSQWVSQLVLGCGSIPSVIETVGIKFRIINNQITRYNINILRRCCCSKCRWNTCYWNITVIGRYARAWATIETLFATRTICQIFYVAFKMNSSKVPAVTNLSYFYHRLYSICLW